MFLAGTQSIGENGHLYIGGCDTVDLAALFGTPLYVIDEAALRQNCRSYREAFEELYPNSLVVFATKALATTALCRIVEQEGLGLDVSSAGELHTGLVAGCSPAKMILHGNYKSEQELRYALEARVGRIVADSEDELDQIAALAEVEGFVPRVLLRITPGVEAHTHEFIRTGQIDSKFGVPIAAGRAMAATRHARRLQGGLDFVGFHCHIGSQILETEGFEAAVEVMIDFIREVADETGFLATELDLGGGLGIRYVNGDTPPQKRTFAQSVVLALESECDKQGVTPPMLIVEPGRSIVGDAGTTLYTVGVVKEVPGIRTYVSVDGGLSDNPRPALYDAIYTALVANQVNGDERQVVTVSGKHCETDTLIRDIELPKVKPGDLLAVQSTGAYNYSMASNYNRFPRPAMVLVQNGQADLIVRRETVEEMISHDVMPERLLQS